MIATGQDITAADLATLAALANFKLAPGTAYVFGASSNDWLTQFNRIRTDLYAKIFDDDTSPIYQSTAALVSDPQCVGINPCPQVADNGKLYLGDALNAMPATGWFPLFKGIKFLYAAIDEDFTFGNPDINFSIPYLTMATTAAALFWGVKYPGFAPGFTDTGSAPNRTFSHTFNYVSPVAATLWLVIQIPLTTGGFDTKTIVQAVAAGSGSVVFSSTGDYNGVPVITSAEFFWPGTTSEAAATVIHPGSAGKQLTLTDIASANFLFTLDTVRGCPFVTVNLPSLRGMWLASTLPTPALNVFLDVDFPPYVQRVIGSEFAGSITPITDGDLHGYWYHRGRSVGTALDWSFVMMDPGNTEMALNPRTSLRQPSPTLPNLTLEFPYDIVALAINANYSGSILFPDDITLHCYGGSANTGVDPLVVTTVVLPISTYPAARGTEKH